MPDQPRFPAPPDRRAHPRTVHRSPATPELPELSEPPAPAPPDASPRHAKRRPRGAKGPLSFTQMEPRTAGGLLVFIGGLAASSLFVIQGRLSTEAFSNHRLSTRGISSELVYYLLWLTLSLGGLALAGCGSWLLVAGSPTDSSGRPRPGWRLGLYVLVGVALVAGLLRIASWYSTR